MKLRTKAINADLLARTERGGGVVVRLDRPWRTVGGEYRAVVVQVEPNGDLLEVSGLLRELAACLERRKATKADT